MPTTNPNGEIIYYIYFKHINKACPKYAFPSPKIDMIVDSIARHEILSFMDGFYSYKYMRINN